MMRTAILNFLLPILLLSFASCDNSSPAPKKIRYLESAKKVGSPSASDLKQRNTLLGQFVSNGIDAYTIVYSTKNEKGAPVLASGLVMFPQNRISNLTLLSYQHGTVFEKTGVPSEYGTNSQEAYINGSVMASMAKGYMVVMPDYLGYGVNAQDAHPYIHRQTMATATIDLIRAVREFAKDSNIGINNEIMLCGYSEGGFATMAVHKMMEEQLPTEFKVSKSMPGAGPYNMEETAKTVLAINQDTDPNFVLSYAWVLATYNRVYNINAPLTDYFTGSNVAAVEALVAGDYNTAAATIGRNPSKVFSQNFRDYFATQLNTPIHQAVQDNRIDTWSPLAKVILYHSKDDEWVPYQNSVSAKEGMTARGAKQVSLVTLSGSHGSLGAIQYFTEVFNQLK